MRGAAGEFGAPAAAIENMQGHEHPRTSAPAERPGTASRERAQRRLSALRLDQRVHHFGSASRAKNAAARRKISFSCSSTRFQKTRQDWPSVVNRHLIPELGSVALWKLTARDCDQMYHRLALAGLGPSRVRNAHVVLHRAVAQAVRWGWLVRNPVSNATRPMVPRTTVVPPTVDHVRTLMAAARERDPQLACWLDLAAATGARRGEVCALRWSDIDLKARTVRIERSVSATKEDGVIIKTTKTDRSRSVSLTDRATESLRGLRTTAERRAATDAREFRPADLVFTNDPLAARPWRPELVSRRWERLRGRVGLTHVKIHGLRHFVATELLTAGIDVRTVANRLGHARTSTTLDIYWAWVPARDRDAADHLQTVLEEEPDQPEHPTDD